VIAKRIAPSGMHESAEYAALFRPYELNQLRDIAKEI
jgi:hypothetical protein